MKYSVQIFSLFPSDLCVNSSFITIVKSHEIYPDSPLHIDFQENE